MKQEQINKIAVCALIFGLLAISQSSAISTFTMNLIAGTGINITQNGDNYTISATGGGNGSDNTKVNKSGDTMTGDLNMGFNNLIDINSISSDFGEYNPYLGIDFLPDSISINHGLHGEKTTFLSNGVINDNSLLPSKYVCTDSNQNITTCDLPADNDSQYVNKSGDTMTGNLNMNNNNITGVNIINISNGIEMKSSSGYSYTDNFSTDLNNWTITGSASIVSGELKIIGSGAWNSNGVVFKTKMSPPYTIEWDSHESAANIDSMGGATPGATLDYTKGAYIYRNSTSAIVLWYNGSDYGGGGTTYNGTISHNKIVFNGTYVGVWVNNSFLGNHSYIGSTYPSFQLHGAGGKISYIDNVSIYTPAAIKYWCVKVAGSGSLYTTEGGC